VSGNDERGKAILKISDIHWINLNSVCDDRGCLTAIEGGQTVPFDIKRVFYMHDVTKGADRGGHAHRDTDQLAVAVNGSLKIVVSDGVDSRLVLLDDPGWGITLPRLTWTTLFDFSDGAVCLVLSSTNYDRSKSIRTWSDYLTARGLPACHEPKTGALLSRPR
jgi:dTDP-4-dehydrorhamnose 3,5-epimerase-like enzyme